MLSGGYAGQGDKGGGSPRRWRDGGWRREFSVAAVDGGESLDGGRRCPEALLRLCKSEEEVRAKPKWEKWGEGSGIGEGTVSVVRPNFL
jgi:hypothetical protein